MKLKEGGLLIQLARKAIEAVIKGQDIRDIKETSEFEKKRGVFVSIYIEKKLRGCVGIPYPIMPLGKAVIEAAQAAAFEDPRFPPVSEEEFRNIRIEISVLTHPAMIETEEARKREDILRDIEVGRDGLIVKHSGFTGLLLPQVAVEQRWNAQKFLEQTCIKAGISPKDWKGKDCKIYKFQAQIFSETKPNGKIAEKKL